MTEQEERDGQKENAIFQAVNTLKEFAPELLAENVNIVPQVFLDEEIEIAPRKTFYDSIRRDREILINLGYGE
jgi:hypothetical protein